MRPQLAWPFTTVTRPDEVWLIAGDEVRLTLRAAGLHDWLPPLLERCDGTRTVESLLADAPEAARALLDQLTAERVVIDAPPERVAPSCAPHVHVFTQEAPDLAALWAFNAARLADGQPWIWRTTALIRRVLIGPVLLGDDGPCARCLVDGLRRTARVPETWAVLDGPGVVPAAVSVAEDIVQIADALVRQKVADLRRPAAFRLHVLDTETLEVTSHRVFRDPECRSCAAFR